MRLTVIQSRLGSQQSPNRVRPDLVEFVHDPHDVVDVRRADPGVEPLDQLAVVHLKPKAGQKLQASQGLNHDARNFDVVVERERVATDDVDVGLGELPVAPFLRSLTAPGLLDLVAPEGKVQLARSSPGHSGQRAP